MNRFRATLLFTICICLAATFSILITVRHKPPFARTLAPLFQELGKPVQSVDRIVSRLLPVNEIDEKCLGEEIKARFESRVSQDHADRLTKRYLQSLVDHLTRNSKKPFKYSVYLINGLRTPTHFLGGVITVSQDLVDLMDNEAELVWILGHEIGHIERGHLFNAARGEMLRRKINEISLITYVDDILRMQSMLIFSKTQEDEADEYGFRVLVTNGYNPHAASQAAEKLLSIGSKSESSLDPLGDFFATHPHTELRRDKFLARGIRWYKEHPTANWYLGKRNLKERTPQNETFYAEENQIIVQANRP